MSDEPTPFIGPGGKPFAVHASAAPEYGAGAIQGLVLGLVLDAEGRVRDETPALLGPMTVLCASLMERGMFDAADVGARYRPFELQAEDTPLRVLPITLFYSGQPERYRASIAGEAALAGADARVEVIAAGVASAIAASVFDMVNGYDMTVAAVKPSADDQRFAAERERFRADLRHAVPAAKTLDLESGAPDRLSRATRIAFWHLVHETPFEVALREAAGRDALAAALTGMLVGAALGRDAIPAAWQASIATRARPLSALLRDA